jgi:hypothetical protein
MIDGELEQIVRTTIANSEKLLEQGQVTIRRDKWPDDGQGRSIRAMAGIRRLGLDADGRLGSGACELSGRAAPNCRVSREFNCQKGQGEKARWRARHGSDKGCAPTDGASHMNKFDFFLITPTQVHDLLRICQSSVQFYNSDLAALIGYAADELKPSPAESCPSSKLARASDDQTKFSRKDRKLSIRQGRQSYTP